MDARGNGLLRNMNLTQQSVKTPQDGELIWDCPQFPSVLV